MSAKWSAHGARTSQGTSASHGLRTKARAKRSPREGNSCDVVASWGAIMSKRTLIPLALVLCSALTAATPPTPLTLVVCAPGYPGSTAEAQPSMDALADAASAAIG